MRARRGVRDRMRVGLSKRVLLRGVGNGNGKNVFKGSALML